MKFSVSSNAQNVIGSLSKQLRQLSDPELVIKQAAFDSQALIQSRVQQKGQNVAGIPMQNKRTGKAYSAMHARARRNKGRQTQRVDLTFKGDMFRSFLVQPIARGYRLGFLSKREADKAEKNEAYYGDVFFLTKNELALTEAAILAAISEILNR